MARDAIVIGILVVAFAALVTAHVAITFGLARRGPLWRAPVAALIVPLAPWWGWQAGMRRRGALWVVAVLVYVVALAFARR